MRIDHRAFALSAAATAALLFTVCAAGVFLVPGPTTVLLGVLTHTDLAGIARPLTLASFVIGIAGWTLGTGVAFACMAGLYNRLGRHSEPGA